MYTAEFEPQMSVASLGIPTMENSQRKAHQCPSLNGPGVFEVEQEHGLVGDEALRIPCGCFGISIFAKV